MLKQKLIQKLKNLRQPKVMGKFIFAELQAELEELQLRKQQIEQNKEEGEHDCEKRIQQNKRQPNSK